jgi:hypothetical protein
LCNIKSFVGHQRQGGQDPSVDGFDRDAGPEVPAVIAIWGWGWMILFNPRRLWPECMAMRNNWESRGRCQLEQETNRLQQVTLA